MTREVLVFNQGARGPTGPSGPSGGGLPIVAGSVVIDGTNVPAMTADFTVTAPTGGSVNLNAGSPGALNFSSGGTIGYIDSVGDIVFNMGNTNNIGEITGKNGSVMLVSDSNIQLTDAFGSVNGAGVITGAGVATIRGADNGTLNGNGYDVVIRAGAKNGAGAHGLYNFVNATDVTGAQAGTLTNAPQAGNPAKWLKIKIDGVAYAIPAWAIP